MPDPVVAAIDMGYGHLRAAAPLAQALGVPLLNVDRPPLGNPFDERFWLRVRRFYEPLTRASQVPHFGAPARALLSAITAIPALEPFRDLSAPNRGTENLVRMCRRGLGRTLAEHLRRTGSPLLTTFYSAAVLSELHGCGRLFCVVTDVDVNRVWAPAEPRRTSIVYLAPAEPTARRLEAYGVPRPQIRVTGFPLPEELLGGRSLPALRKNLAARLARLDPQGKFHSGHGAEAVRLLGAPAGASKEEKPLVTFAVGGAGAQLGIVKRFLPSLAPEIRGGRLELALVAGCRADVARKLHALLLAHGLDHHTGARLLATPDVDSYLTAFNALLARTDVLWTKPSELTFFAALGLPLVLAPPVGAHEEANMRWAIEHGAALPQRDPDDAASWLRAWMEEGVLAAAAWAGYRHLPHRGLYRILDEIRSVEKAQLSSS